MIDNDWDLIDLITGYQPAAAISTAHRLGVFGLLGPTPLPADDLAGRLSVDPSNLSALLEALRSLGLVERTPDGYAATPYTSRRLGPGGEMALVVAKEAVFAEAWMNLDRVVREGRPVMASWKAILETRPEQALAFLEALDVLARIAGPPLQQMEELAPGKRALDVGGGLGTYSRMLDAAGSAVTLVDLPQVAEWAGKRLESTGVTVVGADIFDHPSCGLPPASTDSALVSHLLHDLPYSRGVDLLGRVHNALVCGGRVVVNDFTADSGPGSFGALFDLMMRVETGGAAHPRPVLGAMLREAGFTDPRTVAHDDPLRVLVGKKP